MKTIAVFLLLATSTTLASVEPAALFTDHAVLQQHRPIVVWGTADAGEKVTVSFAGNSGSATADRNGAWQVELPALPANAQGRVLRIAGDQTELALEDILVGEVWLASGQSNMEWPLERTFDGSLDVASADAFPTIRHFNVERRVAAAPQTELASEKGWQTSNPETAGAFSAVAFYFARELDTHLDVPVGIINSTWGGTAVEGWMSQQALQLDPAGPAVAERWTHALEEFPRAKARFDQELGEWESARAKAEATGDSFDRRRPRGPADENHPNYPSNLYNAMIHPLSPVELQGVIWYQGEANASRPDEYATLFPNLIRDWREAFDTQELDFLWVQLAYFDARSHPDGRQWAYLREAQSQALELPLTGQAITLDIGNARYIHPRDKLSVGRRLARLALNRVYGQDVPDSGPTLAEAMPEDGGFRLRFEATDGGIFTPAPRLSGFEIAGEDRDFVRAEAVIDGETVFVSNPSVDKPVAVRYAWSNAPDTGLFNREGLPAAPFRTDDW